MRDTSKLITISTWTIVNTVANVVGTLAMLALSIYSIFLK